MKLYLYSKVRNEEIRLKALSAADGAAVLVALWSGSNKRYSLGKTALLLRKDEETTELFRTLMERYDEASLHNIRKIFYFPKSLKDNQPFFLLTEDSDYATRKCVWLTLNALDDNASIDDAKNKFNDFWKPFDIIKTNFNFYSFGFNDWKEFIGESDPGKRVCRFCGATGKKNFKKIAHAIPESLGNRKVICHEECDRCNDTTLKPIEENFVQLMDVRRCMYRIHRKEPGTPEVNGLNFAMRPNAKGENVTFLMEEELRKQGIDFRKPFRFMLMGKPEVTNQDIFKALCKMVIDCLPSKYLPHFSQTIRWINPENKFCPDRLPKYATLHLDENRCFYDQPVIDLLIKKDHLLDPQNGPYCTAVLYICDMVYIYVMPLVDVDRGFFKYDDNLPGVMQALGAMVAKFHPVVGGMTTNDTTDWWAAYTWCWWDIDPKDPLIEIRPASDPVFAECYEKDQMAGQIKFGNLSDVNLRIIDSEARAYINPDVHPADSDLIDLTVHPATAVTLNTSKNLAVLEFNLVCNDCEDKVHFITISGKVEFSAENMLNHIDFQHGQTDYKLVNAIFDMSMIEFDRILQPRLSRTLFKGCKMVKEIHNLRMKKQIALLINKS